MEGIKEKLEAHIDKSERLVATDQRWAVETDRNQLNQHRNMLQQGGSIKSDT